MKQVLLLLGMYLTYADWFGGDGHDLRDHLSSAEEEAKEHLLGSDSTDEDMAENLAGSIENEVKEHLFGSDSTDEDMAENLADSKENAQSTESSSEEENSVTIGGTKISTSILDDLLPPIIKPEDHIPELTTEESGDEDSQSQENIPVFIGGERDENGCLGSAGYTWCEKQKTCVRQWMLEGEWDDECTTSSSMDSASGAGTSSEGGSSSSEGSSSSSSDSSSESGASQKKQDDLAKFFYNEDGTIKPWVFKVFLGLSITAAVLLLCLIRARRMRKRRQRRRRQSAGVMLTSNSNPDNYARFNGDESNFVFQETVAVKKSEKDDVPNRKEFTNLV